LSPFELDSTPRLLCAFLIPSNYLDSNPSQNPPTLCYQANWSVYAGPNGCGKSNIMDACRWVLDESKASELRGESMQDVNFQWHEHPQSSKPSQCRIGFRQCRPSGWWPMGSICRIAVKRVLTRDGNSSYYINNQAVRRRDVQDVFLGTGLGPRAYAIIGQGTISRIIESRPEELRLFWKKLLASPSTKSAAAKPKIACQTRAKT
jgi:chromosome segregation ATPase